jgi:hypothetical protein
MFDGILLITGLVLSTTVTVNVHVLTLFEASVNVYVTVFVPSPNIDPGAALGVPVNVPSQLSTAVGADHVAV